MFGNLAFSSWPLIIVGASIFAGMFMLVMLMANMVLEEMLRPSTDIAGLGLVAFIGYVAVAVYLRHQPE